MLICTLLAVLQLEINFMRLIDLRKRNTKEMDCNSSLCLISGVSFLSPRYMYHVTEAVYQNNVNYGDISDFSKVSLEY